MPAMNHVEGLRRELKQLERVVKRQQGEIVSRDRLIDELSDRIDALEEATTAPKRRGRPPKQETLENAFHS